MHHELNNRRMPQCTEKSADNGRDYAAGGCNEGRVVVCEEGRGEKHDDARARGGGPGIIPKPTIET